MFTKHRKRRLRRLIVAGMFAAALTAWAVPAASAHTAPGVYHVAVPPVVTTAHHTLSHAFLNHATGSEVQAAVRNVSQSKGTGFAWADAGIGAGVVLMTIALLGGAIQMTRSRRTIATP